MKRKAVKDWKCQECGKLMTLKQAESASFGDGCPKCGGSDIDLDVPESALSDFNYVGSKYHY
jgi:Zn finger protein HypA/HybF involved in hydrogenase expression